MDNTINLRRKLTVHSLCVFFISLYMMLLPLEYVLSSDFGTINKYVGILIIGICLLSGRLQRKIKTSSILIMLLIFYGFISRLWAISGFYWSKLFLIYIKNASLFFVINQCRFSRKQTNIILSSYVFGAILLAGYLLFSSNVTIDPYSGRSVITANGGLFDPNYMAADIIIPIGYTYGVFFNNIVKRKYLNANLSIFVLLILFYIEILSGSRGGLLAIASMIFVITILSLKKREVRRKFILIMICIFIIIIAVIQIFPKQMLDRFSLSSLLGKEDAGGGRLVLWIAALEGIKNNFIFGYGAGGGIPVVGMYYGVNRAVHNLYLSSILQFGIVSSLLYICIYKGTKKALKLKCYSEVGMSVGILVASLFLDALTTKFFWAFLIILFMRISAYKGNDND